VGSSNRSIFVSIKKKRFIPISIKKKSTVRAAVLDEKYVQDEKENPATYTAIIKVKLIQLVNIVDNIVHVIF
jgi:hypothetical protein